MAEEVFTKLAIAETQLETAIGLFVSGRDPISAITLAGAADGILHGLVLKAGKSPFADYAAAVHEAKSKQTPSKAKYGKHINTTLMINALKHMDETDADDVALDVRFCALGAILKAISNLDLVKPERPPYAKAMLNWTMKNFDGEKLVQRYEERSSGMVKVSEKWEAQRPDKK